MQRYKFYYLTIFIVAYIRCKKYIASFPLLRYQGTIAVIFSCKSKMHKLLAKVLQLSNFVLTYSLIIFGLKCDNEWTLRCFCQVISYLYQKTAPNHIFRWQEFLRGIFNRSLFTCFQFCCMSLRPAHRWKLFIHKANFKCHLM